MKRIVLSGELGKHSLLDQGGKEQFVFVGKDHEGHAFHDHLSVLLSSAIRKLGRSFPEQYNIKIEITRKPN